VAGALGLAVLGTIATNHSKALEAQHQALASSLVSGYHLAFAIGAVSILAGIVTALAFLRTRDVPAAAQPATDPELAPSIADEEPEPQIQRQAA
jgi:hypothetical protein